MITALFMYDNKGDVIMSKMYKEGVRRNISDIFRIQVITSNQNTSGTGNGKEVRSPVLTLGSTSFVYIKSGMIWICAVTRSNQDCSVILEFLYKLDSLLRVVGREGVDTTTSLKVPLNEELITNNFVLIHEVLDEVVEFGYPTSLELSNLKNQITSISTGGSVFKDVKASKLGSSGSSSSNKSNSANSGSSLVAQNVTWRDPGIKYRRNEIFLRVEEKINVLMNEEAQVLRAQVDGAIEMKSHLSGMPECHFGLSEDSVFFTDHNTSHGDFDNLRSPGLQSGVTLEDCKFHQCVELKRFDIERSIHFIPPDGDFSLMTYRCLHNINLPFKVYASVNEIGSSRVQYKIRLKSLYPAKVAATNVQLRIPTPMGVIKSYHDSTSGKCKYHPEENMFLWKFVKLFGEQDHTVTAEVDLTPHNDERRGVNWNRPSLKLDFDLEMFSSSGLSVKYLRVQEKANYRTVKWVKYSVSAGSYEIRY